MKSSNLAIPHEGILKTVMVNISFYTSGFFQSDQLQFLLPSSA